MTDKKKIDFKKAFSELEEITAWFEQGDPDLDIGLKKYKRAVELSKLIREKLEKAELEIKQIQDKL